MTNMTVESTQLDLRKHHERAIRHASYSVLVPGLGQLAQRRFGAALVQFGTAAAYATAAIGLGSPRASLVGLALNLWSVVDAYRREPD